MTMINNGIDSFGELLNAFRKRERLTQRYLAEAVGVHRHAIIRWEQGEVLPASKAIVLELARCLHLNNQEARRLLDASLTEPVSFWGIPFPRNPFFTGREEILEKLHKHLNADQVVALTQSWALHGLGGMGKTQIALEYAYRHALEYRAIFWIGAETSEQILSSILRIAELLDLPERAETDQQRIVLAVQRWLTTHSKWLIIWDNLEDLDLLNRFLPSAQRGTSLITTRNQALGTLARGIDLAPMEQEEGMLFLLRRAKILEPDATSEQLHHLVEEMPAEYAAAQDLVPIMGGLPLALDQAGAYIEETGCGLVDYLQRYKRQSGLLLDRRGRSGSNHPNSVAATFLLAMEQIAQEYQAAGDLMHVCAFLHPESIPEELFMEQATHLGPTLQMFASDATLFDHHIAGLKRLSLIQRHGQTHTLSLHRLVQFVLRDQLSEYEQVVWLRRIIEALDAAFPEVTHEVWTQCERLLPHVLMCATDIPEQAQNQQLAAILRRAADYLCERAQYDQAEPLYQQALQIKSLEPEHIEIARSLYGLANLCRAQGRYEQAEPLYQQAIQIYKQRFGSEHPEIIRVFYNLARLYTDQGKYGPAEALYQQTLSIGEQILGPEHSEMAALLNGLAILYETLGKYEQAEPLYQRALYIGEKIWGPDHPRVARLLGDLAILYTLHEKEEQAEPLFLHALHIREQALGPEHPLVAASMNNLALFYSNQGKYDQAEPLFQQASYVWERVWGQEHPQVATALDNLAELYLRQGKEQEAEPLFQQALHIRERALGEAHPQVATSLHGLAELYLRQRRYQLAEPLFAQALRIREQALGEAHPKTVATRTLYTQLLREQAAQEQ